MHICHLQCFTNLPIAKHSQQFTDFKSAKHSVSSSASNLLYAKDFHLAQFLKHCCKSSFAPTFCSWRCRSDRSNISYFLFSIYMWNFLKPYASCVEGAFVTFSTIAILPPLTVPMYLPTGGSTTVSSCAHGAYVLSSFWIAQFLHLQNDCIAQLSIFFFKWFSSIQC